eukprot:TRINITY_DN8855_c0_g1_i1.p1 TRINITY_DN8855_c0_g1~~TRINITY_DN8855_c0_g1_i1.p1  ORF type:complete len:455 (-),score=98.37 TRINITY_DN8855_c0_g1_i1:158-1522(-)
MRLISFVLGLTLVVVACGSQVSVQPEQVSVVFGGQPYDYVISFVTFESFHNQTSVVQAGVSADHLTWTFTSTASLFTEIRCNTTRLLHNVLLSLAAPTSSSIFSVTPGQRIYYRVSSDQQVWSEIFSFVVVDRANVVPGRSLTVSLVGDMGVAPTCKISSMGQWALASAQGVHDMVIHYGDIAYNLDDQCNTVGDNFMRTAQQVGAYTPYVYGVGNHETDVNYTYHTFLQRYQGHHYLAQASKSPSIRWLSFDVQHVHFAMVDTDAWIYSPVYPLAPPQLEWLRQDLSQVNRSVTPWLVVIGHRAMYCTENTDPECNAEAAAIRNGVTDLKSGQQLFGGLEPLLLEFGVDLYFAGHTHHYMRTWPVKKAQLVQKDYVNPGGPVHIQSGIGGVDGEDQFTVPMREYDAWRDENYYRSFSRLVFLNQSHVQFTQHNAQDGSVIDQFVLQQDHHGPF